MSNRFKVRRVIMSKTSKTSECRMSREIDRRKQATRLDSYLNPSLHTLHHSTHTCYILKLIVIMKDKCLTRLICVF